MKRCGDCVHFNCLSESLGTGECSLQGSVVDCNLKCDEFVRFDCVEAIKPNHYNSGKYDVIWFCEYHNLSFVVGNIIKYVFRAGKKDKSKEVQDLKKAIEYINRRIELLEGE